MLKCVLKATVRSSGQGSHARLHRGLTTTKEGVASARATRILAPRMTTGEGCNPDFIPRGWRTRHHDFIEIERVKHVPGRALEHGVQVEVVLPVD
jgi:hypothetical protein